MNISLVSVYLLESQFMEDSAKYFSGVLSAMSCMVGLEVPSVNVMSKMDLVKKGTTGAKRRKDVDRCVSGPAEEGRRADEERLAGSWILIPSCYANRRTRSRTPSSTHSTARSSSSCALVYLRTRKGC